MRSIHLKKINHREHRVHREGTEEYKKLREQCIIISNNFGT
jgi:hypothetical protein